MVLGIFLSFAVPYDENQSTVCSIVTTFAVVFVKSNTLHHSKIESECNSNQLECILNCGVVNALSELTQKGFSTLVTRWHISLVRRST